MTMDIPVVDERSMKSLTEHAVRARLTADELARIHPHTAEAAEARGEARGWKLALILLGGTMPDLDARGAHTELSPTPGVRPDLAEIARNFAAEKASREGR